MRVRIFAFFQELELDERWLAGEIRKTCGVKVKQNGFNSLYRFEEFFTTCEVRDFLDTITIVVNILNQMEAVDETEDWMRFVNEVFREENVKYQLDPQGVVHLFVDETFEIMRGVAIKMLDKANMLVSKQHYERTFSYLDEMPMNTRGAIRSIFDSVESAARELTGGAQLNQNLINQKLKPLVLAPCNCANERLVLEKLIRSFVEWVNACHFYRHAQEPTKAAPPSSETTILMITQGSGFLRLLCSLNTG